MTIETVLYRPGRVRYARNGALFALFMILVNHVSGQANEIAYSGSFELWLNRVMAEAFILLVFAACGYAFGSYKDRNAVGPTVRVAKFPVRQRWACYGAVTGFLLGMAQFVDLSGDGNFQSGVEAAASQTLISPLASTAIFTFIFCIIGRVRDHCTGQT